MWQPTLVLASLPGLSVTQIQNGDGARLVVRTDGQADCVLHWGLTSRRGGTWHCPPQEQWPAGTTAAGQAARTPFRRTANGQQEVSIELLHPLQWRHVVAVLHCPRENRW